MRIPRSVLVTGANRGLGMEFVRYYSDQEECEIVIACCRKTDCADVLQAAANLCDKIKIFQLDVTKQQDIDNLCKKLQTLLTCGLEMLINNAACHKRLKCAVDDNNPLPECLKGESKDTLMEAFEVNAVGPFLLTCALTPLLMESVSVSHTPAVVLNMTSSLASISETVKGGSYNIRLSKVALNMMTRCMAVDLREKEILFFSCYPGSVITDTGGKNAVIRTQTSVCGIATRLLNLGPQNTGCLFRYDGCSINY